MPDEMRNVTVFIKKVIFSAFDVIIMYLNAFR